jgi:hypothetical protein
VMVARGLRREEMGVRRRWGKRRRRLWRNHSQAVLECFMF